MADLFFWNECKKTLERDLTLEEYSTWISPLMLRENAGTTPKSYSVLAPNKFILDWVEENYGESIRERISAITSNIELNLNFEVFEDSPLEDLSENDPKTIKKIQKNQKKSKSQKNQKK